MSSLPQYRSQVKPPIMLIIFVALLKVLFPGWSLQASPKPRATRRRQYGSAQPNFSKVSFNLALTQSMIFGYNSVQWSTVNV